MRKFARNIILVITPLILSFLVFLVLSPFSVCHGYFSKYKSLTQEAYDVTKVRRLKEIDVKNYNTIILGNSKCNALLASDIKELDENSKILNLSSPGENFTHINSKIEYLFRNKAPLKSIILVLDNNIFRNWDEQYLRGPVYIHHPISSEKWKMESVVQAYFYFMEDLYFAKYLKKCIGISDTNNSIIKLRKDGYSLEYNNNLEVISFNKENKEFKFDSVKIKQPDVELVTLDSIYLNNISTLCKENGIKVTVVIGPYYSNLVFSNNLLHSCIEIFGSENVLDFSRSLQYKYKSIWWNDNSHFNSKVGKNIIQAIYNKI